MKMHPPAQINARVTKERLRWLAAQLFTIKVLQPGFKIPSSRSKVFKATDSVEITTKEYVIDDRTKNFIMYELARILSYHGYHSCSTDLGNGNSIFEVSKNGWDMQFKNLRESLPFTECFLAQIENSYNHHVQDAAYNEMVSSGDIMMQVNYGHPRPSQSIDISEIVKDFINDTDKD